MARLGDRVSEWLRDGEGGRVGRRETIRLGSWSESRRLDLCGCCCRRRCGGRVGLRERKVGPLLRFELVWRVGWLVGARAAEKLLMQDSGVGWLVSLSADWVWYGCRNLES